MMQKVLVLNGLGPVAIGLRSNIQCQALNHVRPVLIATVPNACIQCQAFNHVRPVMIPRASKHTMINNTTEETIELVGTLTNHMYHEERDKIIVEPKIPKKVKSDHFWKGGASKSDTQVKIYIKPRKDTDKVLSYYDFDEYEKMLFSVDKGKLFIDGLPRQNDRDDKGVFKGFRRLRGSSKVKPEEPEEEGKKERIAECSLSKILEKKGGDQ